MKRFTKFFSNRPKNFRGHNYSVNTLTMTIPDVVPTLKEIILSGTATQVGTPIYDESFEDGVRRFGIQTAPLEMVLNGREEVRDTEAESIENEHGADSEAAGSAPSAASEASGSGAEKKTTE